MIDLRPIFENHRGPFVLHVWAPGGKHGAGTSRPLKDKFKTGEEAHEEACLIVNDPREAVEAIHVYSLTEDQYIGAVYKRGETYTPWADGHTRAEWRLARGLDVADPQPAGALLSGGPKPVPRLDDPVDAGGHAGADYDGAVRGVRAEIEAEPAPVVARDIHTERAERDGTSRPVAKMHNYAEGFSLPVANVFDGGHRPKGRTATRYRVCATAQPGSLKGNPLALWGAMHQRTRVEGFTLAEIAADVGARLTAGGVEHPERFIGAYASRFKAANLIEVVP